jgi:hypothetical protein
MLNSAGILAWVAPARLEIRIAGRTSRLEAAHVRLDQEMTKPLKLEAQLRHSQKMEAAQQSIEQTGPPQRAGKGIGAAGGRVTAFALNGAAA